MSPNHASSVPPEWFERFARVGRRLDAKGWIAANDGNLSVRLGPDDYLVTASGSRKGELRPEEVLRIDGAGRVRAGRGKPTSELDLHLTIYRERADVRAIVHAHPPVATAFAVARRPLEACVLPEIVLTLGTVPIAPYATPGTAELGASVVPAVRRHDAVLLANHGAVTIGPDLETACATMERVEHGATILFHAHLLGAITPLTRDEVERLLRTDPGRGEGSFPCVPAGGPDGRAAPAASGTPTSPPIPGPPEVGTGETNDPLLEIIRAVLRERGPR